jgi:hypothetical protein
MTVPSTCPCGTCCCKSHICISCKVLLLVRPPPWQTVFQKFTVPFCAVVCKHFPRDLTLLLLGTTIKMKPKYCAQSFILFLCALFINNALMRVVYFPQITRLWMAGSVVRTTNLSLPYLHSHFLLPPPPTHPSNNVKPVKQTEHNFTCHFVWVSNLVCDTKGRT